MAKKTDSLNVDFAKFKGDIKWAMKTIYQVYGFKDREDYFKHLSSEYGLSISQIQVMANNHGIEQDFGKLVDEIDEVVSLRRAQATFRF